ncbi:MAG: GNAT family N-acetyltransferase [Methyloversatilis sp. 12-65-5]|nr:MAG: GNAT family N-acetyltransferase [Methyloversatilis sp. 12-65-5]
MAAEVTVVRVAARHAVLEPSWLARAEPVHRALRPDLPADYAGTLQGIFEDGGEMAVAVRDDQVVGVAVYRCHRNTSSGVLFYIDDLVTAPAARSHGIGKTLLDWLAHEAADRGATRLRLDSGTQRIDAHRFYHREGMHIACFLFSRDLTAVPQ